MPRSERGWAELELLVELLRLCPTQPATCFWRAIELHELIETGLPEGRGLDLGCGDGTVLGAVLSRIGGRECVGVDIDAAEVELARRCGLYDDLHVTPADDVPADAASFDWVLSNCVLEHIPDIESVLVEVARVLTPGGRFIFTVPGPGFHVGLRGPLMPWGKRERYLKSMDLRLAHERYWDEDRWREALGEAGMDLVEARTYLSRAQLRRWENLTRMTSGILWDLTGGAKSPIEIQRSLPVSRGRPVLPRAISRAVAHVLRAGVGESADDEEGTCLLLRARKQ